MRRLEYGTSASSASKMQQSQEYITNLAQYTKSQDKRSKLYRKFNYAFVGGGNISCPRTHTHSISGISDLHKGDSSQIDELMKSSHLVDVHSSYFNKQRSRGTQPHELRLISQL